MEHHHMDSEVDHAFVRLMDELCQWERATSRDGLLLYIPEQKDEPVIISWGGKLMEPLAPERHQRQEIEKWFTAAMNKRYI